MDNSGLVQVVKDDLRIKHIQLNNSISLAINSCLLDLKLAGVNNRDTTDALIQRAIILYCRANVGFSKDSDKYQKAYDRLKDSLALSGDYGCEIEEGANNG